MSNTSHKRRNKNIFTAVLIAAAALIIISFFVSSKSTDYNPEIAKSIVVSEPTSHVKGNLDSELVLIEYSDFQCPACKNAAPMVKQLVEEYGDKFQLEYRHYPLRSIHPNAQIGAQAAEAAGMQGKFWEMHDMLFDNQAEWSKSFNPKKYFKQYAEELEINPDRLVFDLESDKVKDIVNAQYDEAQALQLPGTPAFVSNGVKVDINTFISENLVVADLETAE